MESRNPGGNQRGGPHREAADAMAARWKNPIKGVGWYLQAKKDFKALPEQ